MSASKDELYEGVGSSLGTFPASPSAWAGLTQFWVGRSLRITNLSLERAGINLIVHLDSVKSSSLPSPLGDMTKIGRKRSPLA